MTETLYVIEGGVRRPFNSEEQAEYDARQTELTTELAANAEMVARDVRDAKLAACDWTQAADSPLTDAQKTSWATYRQALRDLPEDDDDWPTLADITWPTEPS